MKHLMIFMTCEKEDYLNWLDKEFIREK